MERYRHRALDRTARQIRLVRIDKECDQGSPINLTLRFVYLDAGEKYNALSYAWGDPPADQEIIVTDDFASGSFFVRQNLYDYLMAARTSTNEWSEGWIWIDQICIDQDNHEERCHQVHQMANLYSQTQTTVVWPGLSTHTTTKEAITDPFNLVFSPEEIISIRHTPYEIKCVPGGKPVDPSVPSESSMRLIGKMTNLFVAHLSTSSYWDRLWVIQEICLAPRVRVILLDDTWTLKHVAFAVAVLRTFYKNMAVEEIDLPVKISRLDSLAFRVKYFMLQRSLQRRRKKEYDRRDWGLMLFTGAFTQCTEPLDRVYGLSGLIHEDLRVYPDYTLSQRELLRCILEKTLLCSNVPKESLWSIIGEMIFGWWRWGEFERVTPAGMIDNQPQDFDTVQKITSLLTFFYNTRLVLQDLELSVPAEHPLTPRDRERWNIGIKVLAAARSSGCELDQVLLGQQFYGDLKDFEHHTQMVYAQQRFLKDVEQAWTKAIHRDDLRCASGSGTSYRQAAIRSKVEEVILWLSSEPVQAEGS